MSDDEGTFEERELLLASSESALSRTDKVPAFSAPPPPETTDANHATPSGWQAPEPLVHFHSLSVNLRRAGDSEFAGGSARIVETDRGGPDDFCSIDVDIIWTPRGAGVPRPDAVPTTTTSNSESDEPAATESTSLVSHTASVETVSAESAVEFRLALDDVLTIRLTDVPGARPTVAIQRRGGAPWGALEFANGPDVLRAFLKALSRHSKRFPIADAYLPGALLCVETQPRMRRAARSLSDHDEPFAEDIGASGDAFVRPIPPLRGGGARALQEQGMSVLEQFARVTQLSREVGESLSLMFNDRKRRELVERRRREQAARQRAMDINAEIVASSQDERALPPRLTLERARGAPVSRAIWIAAMDGAGKLRDPAAMRQAVFSGGVEPDLRRDVWPVLLGVFPWDSTRAQRAQILEEKRALFADMRAKWEKVRDSAHAAEAESMARGGARLSREERVGAKLGDYLQSEEQIEKDIMRTDRLVELYEADDSEASRVMGDILNIYAEHDKKIRYCQGMSDFLSQILYHIGVEHQALVFWCFEGLMQRCECNFRIDQTGIHSQLGRLRKLVQKAEPGLAAFFKETDAEYYTCFRWILVRLKRELPYHATARLWEVLWTRHVGADSLHLYLAVGLLSAHKQRIMALPTGEFDSLLRYINDMSGRIDVDFALREAELWYRKLGPISD